MPDEILPVNDDPTPEVVTTDTTNDTPGTTALGPNGKPWDLDQAVAFIDSMRRQADTSSKERKKAEAELAKANAELQKIKEAELSETERLRSENERLATQAAELARTTQAQRLEMAVSREAHRLNFRDESDGMRYIGQDAIEWDEEGKPSNISKLMDVLAKEKPYLLNEQKGSTSTIPPTLGTQSRSAPNGADEQLAALRQSGRYGRIG